MIAGDQPLNHATGKNKYFGHGSGVSGTVVCKQKDGYDVGNRKFSHFFPRNTLMVVLILILLNENCVKDLP